MISVFFLKNCFQNNSCYYCCINFVYSSGIEKWYPFFMDIELDITNALVKI